MLYFIIGFVGFFAIDIILAICIKNYVSVVKYLPSRIDNIAGVLVILLGLMLYFLFMDNIPITYLILGTACNATVLLIFQNRKRISGRFELLYWRLKTKR